MEYTAQATSPLVNNEVKLVIGDAALTVASLFDTVEVSFSEINALVLADYIVTIKADSGDYVFSRMGHWGQPFYDDLCDAYNKAVLRSLFIKNSPLITANGDYTYSEGDATGHGAAHIHVYGNSVATLPPDLSARRVPLCFVSDMDKGDFELTLRLVTNESYTYAKLGYDTKVFAEAIEKQIRSLREESLAAAKEIDPGLTTTQASQLAKLVPQGAAAPIGRLAQIASSFAEALEGKIATTRAAESYAVFKELSDPGQIWVGFRKNASPKENPTSGASGTTNDPSGDLDNPAGDEAGDGETAAPKQDSYLLWLIAPSPNRQFAAVEFAEANSATFVYNTRGDFNGFAQQLNRALEAINFKREVIRLTDAELLQPENAVYYMAAKRTRALQFIRSNFVGRVIHSSQDKWKRNLLSLFEGKSEAVVAPVPSGTLCPSCGKTSAIGTKFCGECGGTLAAPASQICPGCGFQVLPMSCFCGECGYKLE